MNSSIVSVHQRSPLKTDDQILQGVLLKPPENNLQNKLLRFLETSPAFKDLIQFEKKQQLLRECCSAFDVLSFNENQIIFEQDEPVDGWYVVLKGRVASMSTTKLFSSQEHIMVSSRLISGKDATKEAEEYLDMMFSNNGQVQLNQQASKKEESRQNIQNDDKDIESRRIKSEEELHPNNDSFQETENVLDNFVDLRQSLKVEENGKPNTSHKKRSSRSQSSSSSSSSSSSLSDCLSHDSLTKNQIQKSTHFPANNTTKTHSSNSNRFQNTPKSISNLLPLHILQIFTSGQEFGSEGVLTQLPRASYMISLDNHTIVLKLPHAKYLQCLKTLKDTQLIQNLKIINSCSGLSFLSMHAQKELIIRSHKITLNKGNILCSPTCSPPEAVYLIISGQYSLCTFHRWAAQANTFPFYKDFKHIGNTSIQVSVISSGEIYGDEEVLLKEQTYKYELKCEEDGGEILIIPREVYEQKISNYEHFYEIVLCKNKILKEHREKQIENYLTILAKQNKSQQGQQKQMQLKLGQVHSRSQSVTGKRISKRKMQAMEKKKLAEEKRIVEEKQMQNDKEDRLKRVEIQQNKQKLIDFRVKEQGREQENSKIKENIGFISYGKDNSGNASILNNGMQRNNRREALLSKMSVKEDGEEEQDGILRMKVNATVVEHNKIQFSFQKQEQLSSQEQSLGEYQSYDVKVFQPMNAEPTKLGQQDKTPKSLSQNSPVNKQKLQLPSRNTPRKHNNPTNNTLQRTENNDNGGIFVKPLLSEPSSGQNNTKVTSKICRTRNQHTPVTSNSRGDTAHSQLTIYPSISTTTQISRTPNTPLAACSETRPTTGIPSTLNGTISRSAKIPNQRPITCTGKDIDRRQYRAISTAPSQDKTYQFGEMKIFQEKSQNAPNICMKIGNTIESTCGNQGRCKEYKTEEQYSILQQQSRFNSYIIPETNLNGQYKQYGFSNQKANLEQSDQLKVIPRYSVTDSDQFTDDQLCQERFPQFSGKENSRKGWEPVDIHDSNFLYLGMNETMSRVQYESMLKDLSVKISRFNSSSFSSSAQKPQINRLTGRQQRNLLKKVINFKDLRENFSLKLDEQIKKRIVGFDSKVNFIRRNQRQNDRNDGIQGELTNPIQAGISHVLTRLNFQTDHFTNAVHNFKEKNNQNGNFNQHKQQQEQVNQNATITSTLTDKTTKIMQQQNLLLLEGQSSSSQMFHKTLSSNGSSIERNQFVLDSNFISLENKNHQLRTAQRQKGISQRNKDTKEQLSPEKQEQNYFLKPPFVAFGESLSNFDQTNNKSNSQFIDATSSSSLTQTFLEKSGVRRTPSAEKRATARAKQKKEIALRKSVRQQDQGGQQQQAVGLLSSQEFQSIRLMPCPRQEQHNQGNVSMYEPSDKEGISNYLNTDNSMSQYQSLTLPTEGSIVNNACGAAGKTNEIVNNTNNRLFTDVSGNVGNKNGESKEDQNYTNGSARHQHQLQNEQNQQLREKQIIHQNPIRQRGRENSRVISK